MTSTWPLLQEIIKSFDVIMTAISMSHEDKNKHATSKFHVIKIKKSRIIIEVQTFFSFVIRI